MMHWFRPFAFISCYMSNGARTLEEWFGASQ